jgi:O-antigen ligase
MRISDYIHFAMLVITYISIYILILIFKSIDTINVDRIYYSINYLAIFNGVLGIAQYITGKSLLIGDFNSSILYTTATNIETIRSVGLAGTNNAAGNFGALLFGIVFYNCLTKKSFFSILALGITLTFSILTLTRIGYIAIIVQIIIVFLFYYPKTRRGTHLKIILFTFSISTLIIFALIFSTSIINKIITERGNTELARFIQYDRIFKFIISKHPFAGIGTGQYKEYMLSNFGIYDIDIHSQYLNILAENGLIFFMSFFILNLYILIRVLRSNLDSKLKILGLSLFIANFICSNFNPNQYYYINNVFYYLLLFCIYFKAKISNTHHT